MAQSYQQRRRKESAGHNSEVLGGIFLFVVILSDSINESDGLAHGGPCEILRCAQDDGKHGTNIPHNHAIDDQIGGKFFGSSDSVFQANHE